MCRCHVNIKIAEQGVAARNRNTGWTSHHESQQLNRAHHKRNPHHYSVQVHSQGPQGELEVGVFNENQFLTIQRKQKDEYVVHGEVLLRPQVMSCDSDRRAAKGRSVRLTLRSEVVCNDPRYGRRSRHSHECHHTRPSRDRRCLYDPLPRQRAQQPICDIIVSSIYQQKLWGSPLRRKGGIILTTEMLK